MSTRAQSSHVVGDSYLLGPDHLPPIIVALLSIAHVQPSEKTQAGFLARARALCDQAVREGDQAYGAVVYVMGCRQLWAGSP